VDTNKPPQDQGAATTAEVSHGGALATNIRIRSETEQNAALNKFEQLSLVIQRRMVWVTYILAFVTAAYAFFAFRQWESMQDTNYLAARAAQNAELATRLTQRSIRDAREGSREQMDATRKSNDAAIRLASASEKSARLLSRQLAGTEMEQRAKLVVSVFDVGPIEGGKPLTATIHYANVGRMPAENVLVEGGVYTGPQFPNSPEYEPSPIPGQSVLGNGITQVAWTETIPFGDARAAAVKAKLVTLFVYGRMSWSDSFGGGVLHYCWQWNSDKWVFCPFHNRVQLSMKQ
jgi:hypothetical protein